MAPHSRNCHTIILFPFIFVLLFTPPMQSFKNLRIGNLKDKPKLHSSPLSSKEKKSSYFNLDEIFDGEYYEAKIARERIARRYTREKLFEKVALREKVDLEEVELGEEELRRKRRIDFSWSSIWYKITIVTFFYNVFPPSRELLKFLLEAESGALTDSVTGSIVPVTAILLGTLTSFTISTLLKYQNNIKTTVNAETSCAIKLVKKIIYLFADDYEAKSQSLECVWVYMKTLAVRSRLAEMQLMLYQDPLVKIMEQLSVLPDDLITERTFIDLDKVIDARMNRLTAEGEGIPFVQLNLLAALTMLASLSFLVLTANETISNDSNSDRDVQLLFAVFVGGCTVVYEFIKDLNRPFLGKLNIGKRALTSVNLIQIKNILYDEMGETWLIEADHKFDLIELEIKKAKERNYKNFFAEISQKEQ